MSERLLLEAGTQHLGDPRLAVTDAGTDAEGAYAAVTIGPFRDAVDVVLRAGVPHRLPDGRSLSLHGVGPGRRRPSVALEITAAP